MMDSRTKQTILNLNATLEDAIRSMNSSSQRIVHVVAEDGILQGVVTDPDIRRATLAQVPLGSPVTAIMKRDPVVGYNTSTYQELINIFAKWEIYQLPILDQTGRLVGLRTVNEMLNRSMITYPFHVVLMAGGMGTRLLPHTTHLPKPLVPVHGKPIIRIILDDLLEHGLHNIHISLFHLGDLIKQELNRYPAYDKVRFLEEDQPLGTAGALTLLKDQAHFPILVQNADVLTTLDYHSLLRFHAAEKNDFTIVVRREKLVIPFGVVSLDGQRVMAIREKPEHPYFANMGIYLMNKLVVQQIPAGKRYDMTTLIDHCIAMGLKVGSFPLYEYWADIGSPSDLEKAGVDLKAGDQGLMRHANRPGDY